MPGNFLLFQFNLGQAEGRSVQSLQALTKPGGEKLVFPQKSERYKYRRFDSREGPAGLYDAVHLDTVLQVIDGLHKHLPRTHSDQIFTFVLPFSASGSPCSSSTSSHPGAPPPFPPAHLVAWPLAASTTQACSTSSTR